MMEMWEGTGKQGSNHTKSPKKCNTKWTSEGHREKQENGVLKHKKTAKTVLISVGMIMDICVSWYFFFHRSFHMDSHVISDLRISVLGLENNFICPCNILERRASVTFAVFSFKHFSDRRLYNRFGFRSRK